MLVPDRMIFKRPEYAVPEFFAERSRLKTEGVEECIGATAIDKRRVRVNAVAPGPVWTPLIPSTMPKEKANRLEQGRCGSLCSLFRNRWHLYESSRDVLHGA
jgi:hypothetical protein